MCAARYPIIIEGAFVLADVMFGITEASAIQTPSTPLTASRGVTGAVPGPILRVPTGWNAVPQVFRMCVRI